MRYSHGIAALAGAGAGAGAGYAIGRQTGTSTGRTSSYGPVSRSASGGAEYPSLQECRAAAQARYRQCSAQASIVGSFNHREGYAHNGRTAGHTPEHVVVPPTSGNHQQKNPKTHPPPPVDQSGNRAKCTSTLTKVGIGAGGFALGAGTVMVGVGALLHELSPFR